MNKNSKLDILIIILFIIEIFLVKYFYQTGELLHFRSLFWGFHELVIIIFLGISYILLHEYIGYYDVYHYCYWKEFFKNGKYQMQL